MRLEELFVNLLNMSITASYVLIAVMILRLLLRKAPKWISCALWALVGLRLVLPFSFESVISLIPSAGTVTTGILYSTQPTISSGVSAVNSAVNPVIAASFAPAVEASVNPMQIIMYIEGIIWIAGMIAMVLYSVITYYKLRRKVDSAVLFRDNIYQSDYVASPFVLGIVRPRIYLPFAVSEADRNHVVSHEQTHIRRKDHWIKPFGFLLLTVYWFNPLIWVAYVLLCRDIEFACDEAVIKGIGGEEKKAYSVALLNCAVNRRSIAWCPLAFGEAGVKERVKEVLNYKKPAFWIIIIAIAACAAASICLLSNPKDNDDKSYEHPYAEELFEYRTSFVGDNSAVANIVNLLSFPSDVKYDHIELQTDTEPYGVDVYLNVTPEVKAAYDMSEPENIESFRVNACIMLSLIENADNISFRLDDGTENIVGLIFTREWAESVTGVDLWAGSGSAEHLDSLITQISGSIGDGGAIAPASISVDFQAQQYGCNVELPNDWEELYTTYQSDYGINFYDEANAGYGGCLFGIYWLTDYEAENPLYDECSLIEETEGGGFYAVYPYTGVEYDYEDETKAAEYRSMLADMYGICATLTYSAGDETDGTSLPSTINLPRGYEANAAEDGTLYSNENDSQVTGYIGWINEPVGWLVLKQGLALGSEDAYVYLTYDGGATWKEIGNANSLHRMGVTGAGFASEQVGFISYRYYMDAGPDIWQTTDGGISWARMEITMPEEYRVDSYRFTPLSPQFDGSEGTYPILLYKWRDDGNYDQEKIYMYSHDGGLSWTFNP